MSEKKPKGNMFDRGLYPAAWFAVIMLAQPIIDITKYYTGGEHGWNIIPLAFTIAMFLLWRKDK